MSRIARERTTVPLLSRLTSRVLRARVGMRSATPRVLAAFSAAALLIGSQAVTRVEAAVAPALMHVVPSAATLPALRSAASYRVTADSRSMSSSSPVRFGAGLPEDVCIGVAATLRSHAVVTRVAVDRGSPARARGYDATAPPALS